MCPRSLLGSLQHLGLPLHCYGLNSFGRSSFSTVSVRLVQLLQLHINDHVHVVHLWYLDGFPSYPRPCLDRCCRRSSDRLLLDDGDVSEAGFVLSSHATCDVKRVLVLYCLIVLLGVRNTAACHIRDAQDSLVCCVWFTATTRACIVC